MSVGNESRQRFGFTALTTGDDATSAADAAVTWPISQPITVLRLMVMVTAAVVSSGAVVVKFDKRPTVGSDTSRGDGDVGTVSVPAGTAAGKVVYKDVAIDLAPGDEIVPQITTAAAGGGAAGTLLYFAEWVARQEVAGNLGDMIESA